VSKPIKVWFDGQCFQTASRLRGIGRYAYELVSAIARDYSNIESHISFNAQFHYETLSAIDTLSAVIPRDHIHLWHGLASGGEVTEGNNAERRFSELALTHHVNCIAPDIAVSLSPFEGTLDFAVPLLNSELLQAPLVGVFYDAIPYRFKDKYLPSKIQLEYYKRRLEAYEDFDRTLCISEFSLAELKDLLPGSEGVNIAAGISPQFKMLQQQAEKETPEISGDYVLYVGALDWRKNVSMVVEAFAKLPRLLKHRLKFVLAGDHDADLLAELKSRWLELGLRKEGLISLGHVSDAGLVGLYSAARMLVQPSLMEGFGLTVIEALLCGAPVAAADAGALPETVGSADMLFDPTSPQALADLIESLTQDPRIRKKVLKHGLQQSKTFTWEKTAEITVVELVEVAKANGSGSSVTKSELDLQVATEAKKLELNMHHAAAALAIGEPSRQVKPRLLIDVTVSATSPAHSGIQRVVRKVTSHLHSDENQTCKLIYCDEQQKQGWIEVDSAQYHKKIPRSKTTVNVGPKDHLLMLDSSWHLIDVHLPLLYEARLRGAKVTFCIYDLIPLTASAFCVPGITNSYRNWFLKVLEVATGFICISKAVADEFLDLLELLEFPREVTVDYWRLGTDFKPREPDEKALVTNKRTPAEKVQTEFLMVGTLEPRKGYALALDAFEQLWASGASVTLTLVGRPGWFIHSLNERIRKHPENGHRLNWYDDASDAQLDALYQRSDCLIAASYAEGFGLPIVEAGQMGKPVIATDLPVFREVSVGARSVMFFESGSPASLAETIKTFCDSGAGTELATSQSLPYWPNWKESTKELRATIDRERPYKTHQVVLRTPFAHPTQIGKLEHKDVLLKKHRKVKMRVVDGPAHNVEGDSYRFTVQLTNESKVAWFGSWLLPLPNSIALSYHLLTIGGASLNYENPRSALPIVLGPGSTTYLGLEVPIKWIKRGARYVELEMVQEGQAWFGNSLRVDLGK